MILFWSLVALMLALAVAALLLPLLDRRAGSSVQPRAPRLAAYRARLAEIDQELEAGMLAAGEAQAVRLELERELLRAVPDPVDSDMPPRGPARRSALLVLALFPPAAILLYLHLGQPGLITAPPQTQLDQATLQDMVLRLEARLRQAPDDPAGLRLLARTYAALGRYDESVEALEKVHAKLADDPEVMVELAQALAGAAGGGYAGRPLQLLERAVALQPDHRLGLWLAGGAAAESGDTARALHHWEQLLPLVDDPEAAAAVRSLMDRVRAETPVTQAPANSAAEAALADAAPPFRLMLRIELAPELAQEPIEDMVLYVTARASDGPPMPLAALRLPAAGFPRDVTLDQSSLMIPGTQMAELSRLDVTARISASGRAERQAGDLIGEVAGVSPSAETAVRIVIDSRVP